MLYQTLDGGTTRQDLSMVSMNRSRQQFRQNQKYTALGKRNIVMHMELTENKLKISPRQIQNAVILS